MGKLKDFLEKTTYEWEEKGEEDFVFEKNEHNEPYWHSVIDYIPLKEGARENLKALIGDEEYNKLQDVIKDKNVIFGKSYVELSFDTYKRKIENPCFRFYLMKADGQWVEHYVKLEFKGLDEYGFERDVQDLVRERLREQYGWGDNYRLSDIFEEVNVNRSFEPGMDNFCNSDYCVHSEHFTLDEELRPFWERLGESGGYGNGHETNYITNLPKDENMFERVVSSLKKAEEQGLHCYEAHFDTSKKGGTYVLEFHTAKDYTNELFEFLKKDLDLVAPIYYQTNDWDNYYLLAETNTCKLKNIELGISDCNYDHEHEYWALEIEYEDKVSGNSIIAGTGGAGYIDEVEDLLRQAQEFERTDDFTFIGEKYAEAILNHEYDEELGKNREENEMER